MAQTNARGGVILNSITDIATTLEFNSDIANDVLSLPESDFIMVLNTGVGVAADGYRPNREVIHVATRTGYILSGITRGYEDGIAGGLARAWGAGTRCTQDFTMGMINLATTGIPAHNDTTGKQGGTTGEYYHLTAAQVTALDGIIAGGGDNAYWNAKAKGVPTMLYPPLTDDGDLITWLTNHPKWKQCDGTNGTPNLVDRFIIGSSVGLETTSITGSPTTTGGSKNAVNVSHTHTASQAAHNHTATDSGHTHTVVAANSVATANEGGDNAGWYPPTDNTITSSSGTANITVGDATPVITVDSAGSSGTNANLPPYYSMVFVIKITD